MDGIIIVMLNGYWNINPDILLIFSMLPNILKVIILKCFIVIWHQLMMILMDKFKSLKKLSSTIQNLIKVKETFLKLLIILKEEEEPINFGPKTNQNL
jgi:hypothetical protein